MENLLPKIYKNLSNYLMKYKAVSGEELMWQISQEVDNLTQEEKDALNKSLEGDPKRMIFEGIVGNVRLSVFSPDMHVQLNYLGEVFYTPPTHKYMPEELEMAFKRLVDLRFSETASMVEETICDLLKKSGYEVSETDTQINDVYTCLKAAKDGNELLLFLFRSIIYLPENMEALNKIPDEYIVVIPSERSPAPFVNFIRGNMDGIRENAKLMIWVVNAAEKTVSPFLGTPKDKEIWGNLTDPEKSLQATQNWIKGAVRSRVLDEDF